MDEALFNRHLPGSILGESTSDTSCIAPAQAQSSACRTCLPPHLLHILRTGCDALLQKSQGQELSDILVLYSTYDHLPTNCAVPQDPCRHFKTPFVCLTVCSLFRLRSLHCWVMHTPDHEHTDDLDRFDGPPENTASTVQLSERDKTATNDS